MKLKLVAIAMLLSTQAFANGGKETGSGAAAQGTEVSIMAFNIENLFDTEKDSETDHTYLPLSKKNTKEHYNTCMKIQNDFYRDECLSLDWNEEIVSLKMNRIANVIKSIDNGNGPDVLILEEVENIKILKQLMDVINKHIPAEKAYLEPILLEGFDDRSIDIGVISRLKRGGETKIYPVMMNGKVLDSRGILHAVFSLPDGQKLNVFGVHFPSGGSPTPFREAAIESLNAELIKLPVGSLSVAGGDFNINAKEGPLYSHQLGNKWLVSHLIGCKHCQGTEFYGKEQQWSFLDALLFSKNMNTGANGWVVDEQSIDVPNKGPEQTWQGKPNRFSAEHGVSDHWPIYGKIRKK